MKGTKKIAMLIAIVALFAMSIVVYADPTGVDGGVTPGDSGRRADIAAYNATAIAGNVTELTIVATTITNYWQGYYGNVTGTIVLADSSNNTLYDWNLADANGQVYASRTDQIDWSTIGCAIEAEVTAEDAAIGSTGKADAINETFLAGSDHDGFFVGTTEITAGGCYEAFLHNETGGNEIDLFTNVLLADGDGDVVFTSILNNNALGFDNRNHDFQLIVAENGTNSNTVTTPYYFWVELA